MQAVKTPCIGICSSTSQGDRVCRGCKRYAAEVINWNSYADAEKTAVVKRIEKLVCQILENKLRIFSVPNLESGLRQQAVPYDAALSPYCWLHNLIKKRHRRLQDLSEYGVRVLPEYAGLSMAQLSEQIEQELLQLSHAHYERYIDPCAGQRESS